jgi:hypothetical protein
MYVCEPADLHIFYVHICRCVDVIRCIMTGSSFEYLATNDIFYVRNIMVVVFYDFLLIRDSYVIQKQGGGWRGSSVGGGVRQFPAGVACFPIDDPCFSQLTLFTIF